MSQSIIIECSRYNDKSATENGQWTNKVSHNVVINEGDQVAVKHVFINTELEDDQSILLKQDTKVWFSLGYYDTNFFYSDNGTAVKNIGYQDLDFDYYIAYVEQQGTIAELNSLTFRQLYSIDSGYMFGNVSFQDNTGKKYSYEYKGDPRFPKPPTAGGHSNLTITYNIPNVIISSLKYNNDNPTSSIILLNSNFSNTTDGFTHLATGYHELVIPAGQYDRDNLAKTITDDIQKANLQYGDTNNNDLHNDFMRRTDEIYPTVGLNMQDGMFTSNTVRLSSIITATDIDDVRLQLADMFSLQEASVCNLNVRVFKNYNTENEESSYIKLNVEVDTLTITNIPSTNTFTVDVTFSEDVLNTDYVYSNSTLEVTAFPNAEDPTQKIPVGSVTFIKINESYSKEGIITNCDDLDSTGANEAQLYNATLTDRYDTEEILFDETGLGAGVSVNLSYVLSNKTYSVYALIDVVNIFNSIVVLTFAEQVWQSDNQYSNISVETDYVRKYKYSSPFYFGSSENVLEYDPDRQVMKFSYLHTPLFDENDNQIIRICKGVNGQSASETVDNFYAVTQQTGVFFLDIGSSDDTFWSRLGFNIDSLKMPVQDDFSINREQFLKRITQGYASLSGFVPKGNRNITTLGQTTLNVTGLPIQSSDTVPIFGNFITNTSVDAGFFLVELRFGTFLNYLYEGSIKANISAICGKYNSVASFIEAYDDSAISYTHVGEPIILSSVNVAILDPITKQIIQTLGDKSTIFLEILKPLAIKNS